MKRFLSLTVALALVAGLTALPSAAEEMTDAILISADLVDFVPIDGELDYGMDNFVKLREYDGRFTDAGGWAEQHIARAFEYGIIQGISDDEFGSNHELTSAEAYTIAAKIHAIYHYGTTDVIEDSAGMFVDPEFDVWYGKYVDYLMLEGALDYSMWDMFWNYEEMLANASFVRADLIYLWSKIINIDDLAPIREYNEAFSDLKYPPGMLNWLSVTGYPEDYAFAEIIMFYEAGIINGTPEGTFMPEAAITRAQAAAIFMKLIDKSIRN